MYKLVLALAFHQAAAFVPSTVKRTARGAPSKASIPNEGSLGPLNGWVPDANAFAYGLPGSLDPVPGFDPAGFCAGKSIEEVKMLREAEVTHGRVAMLATVGFIAQERAHFLFVEPDKDIGPAIRHLDEVRAVNPAFFELLTFTIGCCELYRALRLDRADVDRGGQGHARAPRRRAARAPPRLLPGRRRLRPAQPQADRRGRVRGDGDQGAPARPPRDARGRRLLRAGAHRRPAHPRRHLQGRHLSAHSRRGRRLLVVKVFSFGIIPRRRRARDRRRYRCAVSFGMGAGATGT